MATRHTRIARNRVRSSLGLGIKRNACIVGLGRLGSAILNYPDFIPSGFEIKAGFDSNINKIELIITDIPLYPSYEIEEAVRREKIQLGIIAVPPQSAQNTAKKLIDGGVKGIVNFAPIVIKSELKDVFISGVFKFVEDKKFLGEQVKKLFNKPLSPGEESQMSELTSDFGYQASGVEAFQNNPRKWKTTIVEIYIKTPHSPMFFYKSFYISHRIKGTDIEVKIT